MLNTRIEEYKSYLNKIKELQQSQNTLYKSIGNLLDDLKNNTILSEEDKAYIAKLIAKALLQ